MSTINEIWSGRLVSKYRDSPDILGLVELLSSPLNDTKEALEYVLSNEGIDGSEGVFLDFLGELIGVRRPPAQEADVFTLCSPEDAALDVDNRYGLAPVDLSSGGYLTGIDGVLSKSDPGSYATDAEYRPLIRSKAAAFRKKATRAVLYDYLVAFGIRAKITEDARTAELEPSNYGDLNYWVRNYIETRGFKPAGIQIKFKLQTEPDSEV